MDQALSDLIDDLMMPSKDAIVSWITSKKAEAIRSREMVLAHENWAVQEGPVYSFWIQDRLMSQYPDSERFRAKHNIGPLDPKFYPAACELLRDMKHLEADASRLRQGLSVSLRGCETFRDMRDCLPDFMAPTLTSLSNGTVTIQRTRPEAWNLVGNDRALAEHRRMTDLAAVYLAGSLLE